MNPLSNFTFFCLYSVWTGPDTTWTFEKYMGSITLSLNIVPLAPQNCPNMTVFSGSEIPSSLPGLFKHSEYECSPERADHPLGSLKWAAGLPLTTMPPGHRISKNRWTKRHSPVTDSTWTWRHLHCNEYRSEPWMFFPGGILNQFSSHVSHQMWFWKTGAVCNSPLKLPHYPNKVSALWHDYLQEKKSWSELYFTPTKMVSHDD